MHTICLFTCCALLALLLTCAGVPALALASGTPAYSGTRTIGPYKVVVDLSIYPPEVEQPLVVTIIAEHNMHLTGRLIAQPGLGTDGAVLYAALTPKGASGHTLTGAIHLPVRGAWQLVIQLNGLQGAGSTSMDLTVSAPGAMPLWLGWLLGLSPLIGCGWLIWHQLKYRRALLATGGKEREENA